MSETEGNGVKDGQRLDNDAAHMSAPVAGPPELKEVAAGREAEALDDERQERSTSTDAAGGDEQNEHDYESDAEDEGDDADEDSQSEAEGDAEGEAEDDETADEPEDAAEKEDEDDVMQRVLLDTLHSTLVPAHRHRRLEWRRRLLKELLQAMSRCLPAHSLLDTNVGELMVDYLDNPQQHRQTFLPIATRPEHGVWAETFPTTVSKFSGQHSTTRTTAAQHATICCAALCCSLHHCQRCMYVTDLIQSVLSGYPYLLSDEPWPECRTTGSAMTFLLQLRVADFPAVLRPVLTPADATESTLFQCFYCQEHGLRCGGCSEQGAGYLLRWVQPTAEDLERSPVESAVAVPNCTSYSRWRGWESLLTGWEERPDAPDAFAFDADASRHALGSLQAFQELRQRDGLDPNNEIKECLVLDIKLSGCPDWRCGYTRYHCLVCNQEMQLLLCISGNQLFGDLPELTNNCIIIFNCPQHREEMHLHLALADG